MTSKTKNSVYGIVINGAVLIAWLISLIFLFTIELKSTSLFFIILGMLWQTWLYTGLFIVAHDAMHGRVYPHNRMMNNLLGRLALTLYAFFSFSFLQEKHWDHHRYPASSKDPDYNDGVHTSFLGWYFKFMRSYMGWAQIVGMAIAFNILLHLLKISVGNLIIFWIVPAFASTFQLFYFGTYLPHRETSQGFKDKHRARSNEYPVWLSLLTCFHFGYHWEHHAFPNLAWWQLPARRKALVE
ncbi:fatty acid desaturase [candidate division KSB1 bacterium]|nr:fatty acid desaturase [candidate division KSB1 bacterium]